MAQYTKIKNQHKDKILFFRMGDFFEMFDRDAEIAAPILNIALTHRNKNAGVKTKMCGVPHHSISGPISKLLAKGLHVAICDQIELATAGQGLLKRAVTRVLSPGMVYDLETLDKLTANYMGAFDKNHISFVDLSTGQAFYYGLFNSSDCVKLLEQFQPTELVLTSSQKAQGYSFPSATLSVFNENLRDIAGLQKYNSYPKSMQRLLAYIYQTQGEDSLRMINLIKELSLNKEMYYSSQLYSHLEVFKNYDGGVKDTLFSAVNRTKTACGARLLKRRLKSPLIDKEEIEKRWDQIDWWMVNAALLELVRPILSHTGDGERKLGKIVQPNGSARDVLAIALWLDCGLRIEELIHNVVSSEKLNPGEKQARHFKKLKRAKTLRDKIKFIISSDCPVLLKEGGIINRGVNPQLDEWMNLAQSSQTHLLEMEKREQKKLNIPSLKIRYNSVFGYYIEVRKMYNSKIPSHYKRKQTLVHAERYTTEELYALEQKILSARSKQIEMEYQLFKDLRSEVLEHISLLKELCDHWSQIDLYSSLAFLAIENKYIRPCWANHLKLIASRHPVLEQKTFSEFVPNTVDLPPSQSVILTGPNMAGKSTLMRQVALTVLMAQSGCFVPADRAELMLFHKMFTRMGASDFLSQGLSTFMVEMKETAEILEKADDKSLIILDEIGRGTATFDGMSLAQAIVEFLTVEKKPLLFFATHYQELTDLANQHASICNASMSIRENKGQIHFLYLLRQGPAEKSYGIPVARLAGLPTVVLSRAGELLSQYESSHHLRDVSSSKIHRTYKHSSSQSSVLKLKKEDRDCSKKSTDLQKDNEKSLIKSLIKEISDYPLIRTNPIEAMNQIQKWQKQIQSLSKEEVTTLSKGKTESLSDQNLLPDILN